MITKLVRASMTMSLLAVVIEAVSLQPEENKKLKFKATDTPKVSHPHDSELP
jgi:hypothetical protein